MRKRIVVALLRRNEGEIARRARRFAIATPEGHELVARVGEAFIQGFNAMLGCDRLAEVAERGARIEPHWRPFFFEGAAMGYLPRGYHARAARPENAVRDLMEMEPRFRFLYHVGLGFWFGFRDRRNPERIETLAPHLDPLLHPLCYDGFGFKVGFFDYPRNEKALAALEACPPAGKPAAYQGLGRAAHFVHMDDADALRALAASLPAVHRRDLFTGRSLALAFTGIDRPERTLRHLAAGIPGEDLTARLTGVTWALTARRACDRAYFEHCLAGVADVERSFLARLPDLCEAALAGAKSYAGWQQRTGEAAGAEYARLQASDGPLSRGAV